VRVAAALLLIGLTGAPASACPGTCLAMIDAPAREELPAPRVRKPLRLTLRALPADEPIAALRFAEARSAPPPSDDMPWIWKVLREKVYAQMPQHQSESVSLVVAPVVIASTYDTIPGFGVAGGF